MTMDRRRFLRRTWHGVGASLSLALESGRDLFAAPRLRTNPFPLGVASGDPAPDGFVLWTRLAPDPTDASALGEKMLPVGWRIATDEQLRSVVASGTAAASPKLAHSVHVEVSGLKPGRDYFYQFDVCDEESAVGHFRTATGEHERVDQVRFATCQEWSSGYYVAYRDMLANDLELAQPLEQVADSGAL
jgi:alkaline phosphatase D